VDPDIDGVFSRKLTANPHPEWQEAFIDRHRLMPDYLDSARIWLNPLAGALLLHQKGAGRPVLVGINGSQGSGKSTACDYLCEQLQVEGGVRVAVLSLDDFYLTRSQRERLAQTIHPLFATRGVPGTHDMALLGSTLDGLLSSGGGAVSIPRFDKALDERRPPEAWDRVAAGVDLVLLEGWCLGARPQSGEALAAPVNALERDEDPAGRWRCYVNDVIARDFLPLYRRVDQWVMLRAPSFQCVYRWRLEQEQKLAARTGGCASRIMSNEQLARFVQHYQRLTEHCLTELPPHVHYLFHLDEQRRISACEQREKPSP
jgi:D-glycerate 3-kinase